MAKPPAHRLRRRPGWFRPVPLRARHDGWSVARQCAFLVQLYLTGSVATAARSVGMSRASAYRLRARPEARSFAHAWDRVLTPPGSGHVVGAREDFRKVTDAALLARVETPLVQPVVSPQLPGTEGSHSGVTQRPPKHSLASPLQTTAAQLRVITTVRVRASSASSVTATKRCATARTSSWAIGLGAG